LFFTEFPYHSGNQRMDYGNTETPTRTQTVGFHCRLNCYGTGRGWPPGKGG
jgi:hypothetical protein